MPTSELSVGTRDWMIASPPHSAPPRDPVQISKTAGPVVAVSVAPSRPAGTGGGVRPTRAAAAAADRASKVKVPLVRGITVTCGSPVTPAGSVAGRAGVKPAAAAAAARSATAAGCGLPFQVTRPYAERSGRLAKSLGSTVIATNVRGSKIWRTV